MCICRLTQQQQKRNPELVKIFKLTDFTKHGTLGPNFFMIIALRNLTFPLKNGHNFVPN